MLRDIKLDPSIVWRFEVEVSAGCIRILLPGLKDKAFTVEEFLAVLASVGDTVAGRRGPQHGAKQ